ncbi:MAG: M28 family peptidase [Bacteroidales bacterium]|nr:M28 family peptidase [Candidatus Latescibacterota bacterium]
MRLLSSSFNRGNVSGRGAVSRKGVFPAFLSAVVFLAFTAGSCGSGETPEFDGEKAFLFIEEQCDIGYRYPGSPGHRELQRYLADRLDEYGANLSLQPFTGILTTGDTLRNLVNIIGNYNMDSRKRIMLGAHFDTRPVSDMDPDPANRATPVMGANDGASGVAVLLEIARVLQTHKPPVGVDIILFDAEDYGDAGIPQDFCLGSAWFARNLKGYRPMAVIIVDMIGDSDLRIPVEGYSLSASPRLVDEVYSIAERLGYKQFTRDRGPTIVDDHLPLIQAGLRAIDLIDFDYRYWHTIEDTPDKCSPASLQAVGDVLLEYIWQQE